MAEAAGLALGILGLSSLFTACIENFDIVIRAQSFGEDFDLLCTQLSLHRLRLILFGETVGMISNEGSYRQQLTAHPEVRPAIESALNHLSSLLSKADVIVGRYQFKDEEALMKEEKTRQLGSSAGLFIFRDNFEAFRAKIRKNQSQKSTWAVTKWSIHDLGKFQDIINKIGNLIDSLEGVIKTLGLLMQHQKLLVQEIDSVSDAEGLRLLQNVVGSDKTSSVLRVASSAASSRLSDLKGPAPSEARRSSSTGESNSFATAPSRSHSPDAVLVWISNGITESGPQTGESSRVPVNLAMPVRSFMSGDEDSAQKHDKKGKSLDLGEPLIDEGIPQNQRLMASIISKTKIPPPQLAFGSEDINYGATLAPIREADDENWENTYSKMPTKADRGNSLARKIFLELRGIRNANIPFISATPVRDSLDTILASIEGPPHTPYANGIFWISFKFVDVNLPPIVKFHTRIYHPNIDHEGHICADYQRWWNNLNLQRYMVSAVTPVTPAKAAWFSKQHASRFTLGAFLTALCGLLATPNVEDPLVPEIAEAYVTDYARYCECAKTYTQIYATGKKPDLESELMGYKMLDEASKLHRIQPVVRGRPTAASLTPVVVRRRKQHTRYNP